MRVHSQRSQEERDPARCDGERLGSDPHGNGCSVLREREKSSGNEVPANAASVDDIFTLMSAYMEAPAL